MFVLGDADYLYGVGPIIARVTRVYEQVPYRDEPYWEVDAETAQGTPDKHSTWGPQHIYIREASLPRTQQVPRA